MFYKQNRIAFSDDMANYTKISDFETKITSLHLIQMVEIVIDKRILIAVLFKNLTELWIDGYFTSIHADVFRPLKKIKTIYFSLLFFRILAHEGIS